MKKLLCTALALMLLLALGGCGSDESALQGTWQAVGAEFEGKTFDVSQLFEGGMELELRKDGTSRLTLNGQSDEITWTEEDGTLTLSDGKESMTGEIEEDQIVLTINGARITLERAEKA